MKWPGGGIESKDRGLFAPNTEQGFLKAITAAIHDRVRKPSVISISWGGPEDQWTRQSLDVFNQAFHDAALLGITVFCASGTTDRRMAKTMANPRGFPCLKPLGSGMRRNIAQKRGAEGSQAKPRGKRCREAATGGGVSTFFSVPDYQRAPVFRFRPCVRISQGAACRMWRDALTRRPATWYLVDGTETVVGGTSAVAPLWAGLTALINEQLGTRVGFMNPLFYTTLAQHKAFNDISSGTNGDFASKPGWDACTGMGSPNGQAISDALKQIQQKQSEK